MARIRSIHPGLFTDEAYASCSLGAQALFPGIWTECDDQGVFEWKPITLKMRLMPVHNVDVSELLDELSAKGMIARFEHGGKAYGAVRNFCRFQRPKKPKASFPLPVEFRTFVALSARSSELSADDEAEVPTKAEPAAQMEDEGGRVEKDPPSPIGDRPPIAEPKEEAVGKPTKRPKTLIAGDWSPTGKDGAFAAELGFSYSEIQFEAGAFRDYWLNRDDAQARKSDWGAAWRTWCRRSLADRPKVPRSNPRTANGAHRSQYERGADAMRWAVERAEAGGDPYALGGRGPPSSDWGSDRGAVGALPGSFEGRDGFEDHEE